MSTLLLRLAAPLQAWGINSKFDIRKTEREPSKSGVVGLLAAALGRRRDESLDDLTALTFGVRSDKEGELLKDFHMVLKDKKTSYVTTRYYLADAIFLVGLESRDETFLNMLDQALQAPVFPLFLGRRSCPPTFPLSLGIRKTDLLSALKEEPWQVSQWEQERIRRKKDSYTMRIVTDAIEQEEFPVYQKDLAKSFNPMFRKYGYRMVKEHKPFQITFSGQTTGSDQITIKDSEELFHTEHDPMKELR